MAGSRVSDLLRSFVAIADHGSFIRAGAVVGRSQSAVSLQMKRLEDTAGCSLFRRQSHGVTLTVRGQGLLRHARGILRLIERAAGELNGEARSEEHTSELQSLMRISYAVFCLKKKK